MASKPAAQRLPKSLQLYILHLALYRIHNVGGVKESITSLLNLSLVCKEWRSSTRHQEGQFCIIASFLRSPAGPRGRSIKKFDSGPINLMLDDMEETFDAYILPITGLRLFVDCVDGRKRSDRDESQISSTLRRITKQFSEIRLLELRIENGDDVDLAIQFSSLTTLLLFSSDPPRQARIAIRSSLSTLDCSPFASTLSRLDLYNITIRAWECTIPSVKILTLELVTLGRPDSSTAGADVCRNFFDSFPSLHSIAFNSVSIPYPIALIRLKVYGIKNLYLGPDCYIVRDLVRTTSSSVAELNSSLDAMLDTNSDTSDEDAYEGSRGPSKLAAFKTVLGNDEFTVSSFLRDMSRYFRCRIKHLWLPPGLLSYATAEEMLKSRSGRPFPPYLAKLETVTYCRAIKKTLVMEGRAMTAAEADLAFEQSGFKSVETREWDESELSEDDSPGTLRRWQPISW